MKLYTYNLSLPFSGHIQMNLLSYTERIKVIKELNFRAVGHEVNVSDDNADKSLKLTEMVIKNIIKVDAIIVESGEKIESIDELTFYKEGVEVIGDLTSIFLSGVVLGKPLSNN